MNRLLKLAITPAVVGLLFACPMAAQESPTTTKAARVQITKGPEIELSKVHLTIVRWECNNPGGSPVHYGIVRYGTDPKDLRQMAKNPLRLNPGHPSTVFRVRMDALKPGTTYYYTVESMEANGKSDGVKSTVNQFKTPSG